MTEDTARSDYILRLPLDPQGANDPAIIEGFPEHARILGFILAEWSVVEFKLAGLLAIGLKSEGASVRAMIYAIESSGARLDCMEAGFQYCTIDSLRDEALELIADARSLLRQRNKFAHAIYGESASNELAIIGMRREEAGDLALHDLTYQFARMKDLSFRIGRAVARLAGLYTESSPTT